MASEPFFEPEPLPEAPPIPVDAIFRMSAIFTDTGVSTRSMGVGKEQAESVFDAVISGSEHEIIDAYLFARTGDTTWVVKEFHSRGD